MSRVPRPPLDGLIDDLYYLAGHRRTRGSRCLRLRPRCSSSISVRAPFRIRGGADAAMGEYGDGCVVTMPTRAYEFGYPPRTRSVGVHVKPWGLGPFLPMPAAELRDRPVTVERIWGRRVADELRERLDAAGRPYEMSALLGEELRKRQGEQADLGLVRRASGVIAAAGGRVAIGGSTAAAGVSSTHLARGRQRRARAAVRLVDQRRRAAGRQRRAEGVAGVLRLHAGVLRPDRGHDRRPARLRPHRRLGRQAAEQRRARGRRVAPADARGLGPRGAVPFRGRHRGGRGEGAGARG